MLCGTMWQYLNFERGTTARTNKYHGHKAVEKKKESRVVDPVLQVRASCAKHSEAMLQAQV